MIIRNVNLEKNEQIRKIDWVKGTNGLSIEFIISGINIANVTDVNAYSMVTTGEKRKEDSANISLDTNNNGVIITPQKGLFEIGSNLLQIEIYVDTKQIFSFIVRVNVQMNLKDGAVDPEEWEETLNKEVKDYIDELESEAEKSIGNKCSSVITEIEAKRTSALSDIEKVIDTIPEEYADLDGTVKQINRRIKNLEQSILGNHYYMDEEVGASISVDKNALPNASLSYVNGLSRKGKNLIDYTIIENYSFYVINGITSCGQTSKRLANINGLYISKGIYTFTYDDSIKLNTYAILSESKMDNGLTPLEYQDISAKAYYGGCTLTFNNSGYLYMYFIYNDGSSDVSPSIMSTMQIEKGSTATDFEPYSADLIDAKVDKIVSTDSEGNTVDTLVIPSTLIDACPNYGIGISDTCRNYIDFDRQVFVRQVGVGTLYDLGSPWTTSSKYQGSCYISSTATINMKKVSDNILTPNFEVKQTSDFDKNNYAYGKIFIENSGAINVWVKDGAFTDDTERDNLLKSITCYYELATPQEIVISDYLTDDSNWIEVEGNGTVTTHYPSLDDGYEVNPKFQLNEAVKVEVE